MTSYPATNVMPGVIYIIRDKYQGKFCNAFFTAFYQSYPVAIEGTVEQAKAFWEDHLPKLNTVAIGAGLTSDVALLSLLMKLVANDPITFKNPSLVFVELCHDNAFPEKKEAKAYIADSNLARSRYPMSSKYIDSL